MYKHVISGFFTNQRMCIYAYKCGLQISMEVSCCSRMQYKVCAQVMIVTSTLDLQLNHFSATW